MLKGILNMHCQWRRCRQLLHMITLLLMCFSLLTLRRCNQAQHLPEPLASVSCVCMWRRDTHALEWFETIKPCKATVRYEPVIKRAPPEEEQDKGSKRAKVEPGLGAYATPPATPVTSVLSAPRPSSALGRAAHLNTREFDEAATPPPSSRGPAVARTPSSARPSMAPGPSSTLRAALEKPTKHACPVSPFALPPAMGPGSSAHTAPAPARPVARPLTGTTQPSERVNQEEVSEQEDADESDHDAQGESALNSGKYGVVHDPKTGLVPGPLWSVFMKRLTSLSCACGLPRCLRRLRWTSACDASAGMVRSARLWVGQTLFASTVTLRIGRCSWIC